MSEDERLELVGAISEAHAVIRETALRLRRELARQSPLAKAAAKAEQGAFRLKRELERLDLEDPQPAPGRGLLPEVRQGGQLIDVTRLRRKGPGEER